MNLQRTGNIETKGEYERVIRVFVSSTFRDMKAERNELVLKTFPLLRNICTSRGVSFIEIDLRWGITEEQVAEGKVLPICLEEINRCRPYFIGLLGERYGWVNTNYSDGIIEKEPWIKEYINLGTSITELEMRHGVLNNHEMNKRAFFYFRDPNYINQLPLTEKLSDYYSEDVSERGKLKKLKESIREASKKNNCFLREENYMDVKQLSQWIVEDFTKVIDKLFPENEAPNELSKIRRNHEIILNKKASFYIGNKENFDRLTSFVNSKNTKQAPLVILGEPGSGKSSLLANWLLNYKDAKPNDFIITHFIGSAPDSSNYFDILRRIMLELKDRFGFSESVSYEYNFVINEFPIWLKRASANNKIVLLLDALDKLDDQNNALELTWFPFDLPNNFYLIVSTIPGPSLEAIKLRNWMTSTIPINVNPFIIDKKRELAKKYLFIFRHELSNNRLERIITSDLTSNPLFLITMLEELRIVGEHESLDRQIEEYLSASNTKELFIKIIQRWLTVYSEDMDIVAKSLRLIWASRHGLSETELLGMLGKESEPLPRAYLEPFLLASDSYLITRSGLLDFDNAIIREAIKDELCKDPNIIKKVRFAIANYFGKEVYDQARVEQEIPFQLAMGGYTSELKDFLLSPKMLRRIYIQRNLAENTRYWLSLGSNANFGTDVRAAFESMITAKPEPTKDGLISNALGHMLSDLGSHSDAIWFNERAHKYYELNISEGIEEKFQLLNNKATYLIDAGKLKEAKQILEEILSEATILDLKNYEVVLVASSNYAHLFHVTGNIKRAHEIYSDTSTRTANVFGKNHPLYIKRRNDELCLAMELDYRMVHEPEIMNLIDISKLILGTNHITTDACIHNLGSYYEMKGDLSRALNVFLGLLKSNEINYGEDSYQSLRMMISTGRVLAKMMNYKEAVSMFSICFTRSVKRHGPLHVLTLECLHLWITADVDGHVESNLEVPFTLVFRAFNSFSSDQKDERYDLLINRFVVYFSTYGFSQDEIIEKYKHMLTNK